MSEVLPKVIALVGMPGSGKSSGVQYLEQKGWPSVYFGGVVVDEVRARGQEVNEANERVVREELRANEGLGAVAKRIIPKINALAAKGHSIVIADGLYGWTEYKVLEDTYGAHLVVIAIVAPRAVRHDRLANRSVRPLTEEQADSRDRAEIENSEKGGPIAYADYTIVNEGTLDDMVTRLDSILQSEHIL